jgi:hypothetical protein
MPLGETRLPPVSIAELVRATLRHRPDRILVGEVRGAEAFNLLQALNTLHRKVLWSLFTMRPVVFVGFSVGDPAFRLLLRFVVDDFELPFHPPPHIGLFPGYDDARREEDIQRLRLLGVQPVFYPVVLDAAGNESHDGLPALIQDVADRVGVRPIAPGLRRVARRFLEVTASASQLTTGANV